MPRLVDRRILLVCVGLLASAGIGEAALRWVRPRAASEIHQPEIYEEDVLLGFRYRAGATGRVRRSFEIDERVRINSGGFPGPEPAAERGPGPRIAVVGDSFTAALYLDSPRRWLRVLERELRRRGLAGAELVNLGLDGTGTDVHLDIVRREWSRLRPDAVLLAFYGNDVEDVEHGRFRREGHRGYVLAYQTDSQRGELRRQVDGFEDHPLAGLLHRSFDHSYLVRAIVFALGGEHNLLRVNFRRPRLAEVLAARRERGATAPPLSAVFDDFDSLAEELGFALYVAPVPAKVDLHGSARMLARHVPRLDARLIDANPRIERELARRGLEAMDLFWRHDNHLNALGNEVFGRALAKPLARELQADRALTDQRIRSSVSRSRSTRRNSGSP
jgi:lysophospholipase L1-like esterase